ncbi:MAG: hypothetical protein WAZ19_16620 [Anaerolineae bacterium]
MPQDTNFQIKALRVAPKQTHLAMGVPLAQFQLQAAVLADENAPHFTPEREPTSDGVVYTSTAGQNFYRPHFQVKRGTTARPEVRFLRDAEDKIRLEIVLQESNPQVNAEPFNVLLTAAVLRWNDAGGAQRFDFAAPTLIYTGDPVFAQTPNYEIRLGAELNGPDVERLNQALSNPGAGAALDLSFSYSYWIDKPVDSDDSGTSTRFDRTIFARTRATSSLTRLAVPAARVLRDTADQPPPPAAPGTATFLHSDALHGGLLWKPNELAELLRKRQVQPNFHTALLTRTLPFTFDANLAQNRAIYAAIRTGEGVSERWESTAFGFVRNAPVANTVYRLPDEIRLAYSDDLNAPHMIPVLFHDAASDETRVRVVLQAAPWHDPQKLADLGDFLYSATAGGLAAPSVITGGYKEAKLTLTGAFPEQITALKGQEFAVDLEGSFELVLDLTLEFYRFLCELLLRAGLTGELTVTLENAPAEGAPAGTLPDVIVRRVPMRLKLDELVGLPMGVSVSAAVTSPNKVEISNRSALPVQCGGCIPRLLQVDDNSVTPLEVYKAEATTPFPAALAAGEKLEVQIKPKQGSAQEGLLWNAVQVELLDLQPTVDNEALLNRVHELAPAGSLTQDIVIESPIFRLPQLPDAFAGKLFRLVVELTRPGFAAQQLTLSADKPETVVKMQRTLQDLIKEDAQALLSFTMRVKNVYFTQEGAWSAPQPGEGSSLFIFPNPVEI